VRLRAVAATSAGAPAATTTALVSRAGPYFGIAFLGGRLQLAHGQEWGPVPVGRKGDQDRQACRENKTCALRAAILHAQKNGPLEAGRFDARLQCADQGTLNVVIWNGLPEADRSIAPAYSMLYVTPLAVVGVAAQPLGLGHAPPSEKITGP